MEAADGKSSRRRFLQQAGGLAAAVGLGACAQHTQHASEAPAAPVPATPPVLKAQAGAELQRRTIGKTGLEVTVIGFGCGSLNPQVVRRGIDQGINYVDTSHCYGTEEQVGQAIKGVRDKVVLCTKWCPGPDATKDQILAMLDTSLQRMGTDHIDLLLLHMVGDHGGMQDTGYNRIDNPALYEAIETARKSGKARFFGISSHVGQRKDLLTHAIGQGVFDAILVAYSYDNFTRAEIPALLKLCQEKKIGVIGMKATGGNHQPPELAGEELDLYQAQLKWAILQGCATVINTRISKSLQDQDRAIAMAQQKIALTSRDTDLLQRYSMAIAAELCRGCSEHCQSACPESIRIADILRYRMYYRGYGDTQQALQRYNALRPEERLASRCGECNLCSQSCPFGLRVVEQLFDAKALLTA
ncbi:MAG: aldo/keto reductase [Armatimonadetes bacterium]|nr:aldo/keto reductase [Armatimonadota bacterium]